MIDRPPEPAADVAEAGRDPVRATLPDGTQLSGLIYRAAATAVRGPLCLCIHGLGVDANVWRFVVPRLCSRGFNVLCLDLHGHGLSDGGGWRGMQAPAMGRELLQALHCLGLEPDLLLAQSFGTRVALELLRCYSESARLPTLYAVAPVWTGSRKSLRSLPKAAASTTSFLRAIGRRVGFCSHRRMQRRDHTRYAQHPDSHFPRFVEEAASISWLGYARLLAGMRTRDYFAPEDWGAIAHWPVCMIGATDEGLWNNRELEMVQQKTRWPLYWLEMRHVAVATDPRFPTLHLTLMTLLRQRVKPDRTELWVYRDDLARLPRTVRRLERQGLTIRTTDRDLKSYTKLIPALIDHPEAYICTAADDTYYPQGWLEALTKRVVEGERCVLCHRAYCIRVDADGNPRPYRRWEIETRRETADARVFLTGVGGVLYPPGCFDAEVLNEAALLSLAPRADDLWFYFMLRRNGYRCRKVPGRLRLRMWASTSAWSVQPFSTVSGPAPRRRPQPSSKISTAVPLRPLSRARNRP